MLSEKLQNDLFRSSLDVVTSMAYVSALREIADAETSQSFTFNRQGYAALAQTLALMAQVVEGDLQAAYLEVATRVHNHAQSL